MTPKCGAGKTTEGARVRRGMVYKALGNDEKPWWHSELHLLKTSKGVDAEAG